MGRCLSIQYGPLYIQYERNATVLITRNDKPMSILLSLSEWNFLLLSAQLHGWPIAPPLDMIHDYSLDVTPWDEKEETGQ